MAIVYGLAANICMPLCGKPARAKALADKANELVMSARVDAANSNNESYESIPDWIMARGFNSTSLAALLPSVWQSVDFVQCLTS
jgi:hypothetical protein